MSDWIVEHTASGVRIRGAIGADEVTIDAANIEDAREIFTDARAARNLLRRALAGCAAPTVDALRDDARAKQKKRRR